MTAEQIDLPAEFVSGNEIQVERATITRARMAEILSDAVQADRARREPGDGDLLTIAYMYGLEDGKCIASAEGEEPTISEQAAWHAGIHTGQEIERHNLAQEKP